MVTAVVWGGRRKTGEEANCQRRGKDVEGGDRTTRDYTSTQYGRDSCRTSSGFILNIVFIGPFCAVFRPQSSLYRCIDLEVCCYRKTGAKRSDLPYGRRIVISRLSFIGSLTHFKSYSRYFKTNSYTAHFSQDKYIFFILRTHLPSILQLSYTVDVTKKRMVLYQRKTNQTLCPVQQLLYIMRRKRTCGTCRPACHVVLYSVLSMTL